MSRLLIALFAFIFVPFISHSYDYGGPMLVRCVQGDSCTIDTTWTFGEMEEASWLNVEIYAYAEQDDPLADDYCATLSRLDINAGNGWINVYPWYQQVTNIGPSEAEVSYWSPNQYIMWSNTDLGNTDSMSIEGTYAYLGYERLFVWLEPIDWGGPWNPATNPVTCGYKLVSVLGQTYDLTDGGHASISGGCGGIDPDPNAMINDYVSDEDIMAFHANAEWFSGESGEHPDTSISIQVWGDHDRDGVRNDQDNCVGVQNTNQYDSNDDGYGNACDCDFNDDGVCGGPDSLILSQKWLCEQGQECWDEAAAQADMNGDGVVGGPDSILFSQHWLEEMDNRGLDHCN